MFIHQFIVINLSSLFSYPLSSSLSSYSTLQVDICPINILKTTRTALAKVLRSYGKLPFPVKELSIVDKAIESITTHRVIPVITVSSVTGQGR